MPAIIRILSGPGSGREHWIDSPVMRIGSHPESDFCLPSPQIAQHAITLEFRNKQYVVLNRSEQAFRIGKRTIEKGAKDTWANSEQLEFPGVAMLTLYIDRDPAPCPKPKGNEPSSVPIPDETGEVVDESIEIATLPTKSSFSRKEMLQLAVTIACCVGVVAILAFKAMPQKIDAKVENKVSLSDVLEDSRDPMAAEDKSYQVLIDELKVAGVLRSKGDKEGAVTKLQNIRSLLHEHRNAAGSFDKAYEENLYRLVASMIAM